MCNTPRIRASASAPANGVTPADNVQVDNRDGVSVSRTDLVSKLGFKRSTTPTPLVSQGTFGDAMAGRLGFPAAN